MEREWCEHGNMYDQLNLPISPKIFKFCPHCGAPRPEKKKGLVEKLYNVAQCGVAEVALTHFLGVIDDWHLKNGCSGGIDGLNKKMKDSL